MKKDYLIAILFFGGLWGLSEAALGDALYTADVPFASVLLTAAAFFVLSLSRGFYPQLGTATLIAACAMLYKFLNTPFFGCHLLAILLTGMAFDLYFAALKLKTRPFAAVVATYSSYVAFALLITYVFGYAHWPEGGLPKIARHVFLSGSLAAACSIPAVMLASALADKLKDRLAVPTPSGLRAAVALLSLAVVCLWIFPAAGVVIGR